MIKKKYLSIIFACIYFVSYVTRISLAAVIQEAATDTGYAKSELSVILVCLFFSYGIGQIISGALADRFKPQNLIMCGLVLSTLMNLFVALSYSSISLMCLFWTVNGFAQSMMWPPIVKILVSRLDEITYGAAVVTVNLGASVGTVLVYLISPLFIRLWNWQSVLVFASLLGGVTSVAWCFFKDKLYVQTADIKTKATSEKVSFKNIIPRQITLPFILIAFGIIFQGMLRDGVTSWMPSYLAENFEMGNDVSIFCTVSLALFSFVALKAAGAFYKRFFKNEVSCATVLFGGSVIACFLLLLLFNKGPVFAVILMTAITGFMHGINLMLVCHIPKRFSAYGNVSTVSGIINSFTYIGATIAIYGIAKISEIFGWKFTVIIWLTISILGMVCCISAVRKWKLFIEKNS